MLRLEVSDLLQFGKDLSSLVEVDQTVPQVVRITITDEAKVSCEDCCGQMNKLRHDSNVTQ